MRALLDVAEVLVHDVHGDAPLREELHHDRSVLRTAEDQDRAVRLALVLDGHDFAHPAARGATAVVQQRRAVGQVLQASAEPAVLGLKRVPAPFRVVERVDGDAVLVRYADEVDEALVIFARPPVVAHGFQDGLDDGLLLAPARIQGRLQALHLLAVKELQEEGPAGELVQVVHEPYLLHGGRVIIRDEPESRALGRRQV
mmetsp:Transcript_19777/g.66498  ORF Transcript_19777/g.66498 Transcript_19777/m.66498 type:complete len:200 (-) Transcript_19777:48-647(-)